MLLLVFLSASHTDTALPVMPPDRWLTLVLGNTLLDEKPLLKSGMD